MKQRDGMTESLSRKQIAYMIDERLASIKKTATDARSATRDLERRVELLDAGKVAAHLAEMEEDITSLHRRLHALIARTTVATEVSRLLGTRGADSDSMRQRLITLFDQPDDFWTANGERELGQWLRYLRTGRFGNAIHAEEAGEAA